MGDKSAIEWTDATWNPVTGCTKISPGCKHCYAERLAVRLQAMGNPRYRNAFDVTLHPDQIELPLRWRRPRRIFVNSMSDLYHEAVPDEYIQRVFEVMVRAEQHVFQVLTKRSERLPEIAGRLPWPPNVWQGVSVENADYVTRIADLGKVPAAVRFLSVEPLLGPIPDLPLEGIHWVICGGESGHERRELSPEWARLIRDQCVAKGVPFFFKQWGGRTSKSGGRTLDGRTWDQMPPDRDAGPREVTDATRRIGGLERAASRGVTRGHRCAEAAGASRPVARARQDRPRERRRPWYTLPALLTRARIHVREYGGRTACVTDSSSTSASASAATPARWRARRRTTSPSGRSAPG